MKRGYPWITRQGRHYETLLFAGLLCWIVIIDLLERQVHSWAWYAQAVGVLLIVHTPVLLFSWYKTKWQQSLSPKRYWLYWLACFGGYIWVVFFLSSSAGTPRSRLQQLISMSALFVFLLELLLIITAWSQRVMRQWEWVKKISLERSVLISIALIAFTLSVMAVSSMGDPAYDSPGRLLLGFEFSIRKVFGHIGTFLGFLAQFLFMYGCGYFFFYLNNRVLVPKILKTKGLVLYVLCGLAAVGLVYPVIAQLLLLLPLNQRLGSIFSDNPFAFENALGAILIILLSLPVVLALQWGRQNSQIVALQKEQAETELDLLKQQLNPHFFFNTLNNLYALSLTQSKQTPESILQLSELMRYVIYKAKEPVVPIQEEIKYLEDYIQLQQIRLKRKPDIQFTREVGAGTPPIAPLLLIVLVENAFKHGIEPAAEPAFLHITLRADARGLYFRCTNSAEQEAPAGVGIGLANLQKRLALLYPGKHRLKTGREKLTFTAELELDLT